jgi:hypothetical protein
MLVIVYVVTDDVANCGGDNDSDFVWLLIVFTYYVQWLVQNWLMFCCSRDWVYGFCWYFPWLVCFNGAGVNPDGEFRRCPLMVLYTRWRCCDKFVYCASSLYTGYSVCYRACSVVFMDLFLVGGILPCSLFSMVCCPVS